MSLKNVASDASEYSSFLEQSSTLTQSQSCRTCCHVFLMQQYWLLQRSPQQQQDIIQHLVQTIRQTRHQSQSLLAVIDLYAELLQQEQTLEGVRSRAHQIQTVADQLKQQLKTMSVDSPEDPLNLGWHDLRSLVCNSVSRLQVLQEQKLVSAQLPSHSVMLSVDAWKLSQVFNNLFENAIHFSPSGGTIFFNWEPFRHEILVEMWDEGPGLSDADLQSLFTPFYSQRPNGTGLGLVIAQQIVQRHRGRLWASNVASGGAKFSFTLPR